MDDLLLITKNATTCISMGNDSSLYQDISVTVGKTHGGNTIINITLDVDGLLMLILNKEDAARLCSEIGRIILQGEVLQ